MRSPIVGKILFCPERGYAPKISNDFRIPARVSKFGVETMNLDEVL